MMRRTKMMRKMMRKMKMHTNERGLSRIVRSFDRLRFWNNPRNRYADKLRLYGIWNMGVDLLANVFLSFYFRFAAHKPSITNRHDAVERGLIVSLTSFPKRIGRVWLTVETLLRQTVLPERIILWLSRSQFPHGTAQMPRNLLRLRNRGLEIRFVDDDLRSHKKYFYAMQEFPEANVVTVDDDMLYPSDMLDTLWRGHVRYPAAVVGNRGKMIYASIPRYEHWPALDRPTYSEDLLFVGCSGILYPPHCLHRDAFRVDLIKSLAFTADDIWLSCMARLNNAQMFFTGYGYNHLRTLIYGDQTLYDVNSIGKNQDVVTALNEWYGVQTGKRPFVDMVGTHVE